MSNQMSDALAALEAREILPNKPINLPAAALYYADKLRWPVFPLKPRGKKPVIPKAHPNDDALQLACQRKCGRDGHGLHDATTDLERVREWWTRWPEANIGLRTGGTDTGGCGFDVIDADGPAGVEAWTELKHRNCPDECSTSAFCGANGGFDIYAEALTPGNATVGKGPGRHIFVPSTGARNDARVGDRPIDIRAAGGYVVAVPSLNLIGAAYTWITPPRTP